MHFWRTGFLLHSILFSIVLPGSQAWAGDKLTKGSTWVIIGKIEVPPRKATIYFQDGSPVAAISGNQYAPWCALGFYTKDRQKYRNFVKGSFEITKISYEDETIDLTNTNYKIRMALKSVDVPDVTQIVCGNWDDNSGNYLTVKQMRQAMDGVMKLNLKAGK